MMVNFGNDRNAIKLPGKSFTQKFLGKMEQKTRCPSKMPDICGCTEKEPVVCLLIVKSLCLLRNILKISTRRLSHLNPETYGTVFIFFLILLEKTVIVPVLLRPALLSSGFLKNFTTLVNFIKNVDFLNLFEGVSALCCIVKI